MDVPYGDQAESSSTVAVESMFISFEFELAPRNCPLATKSTKVSSISETNSGIFMHIELFFCFSVNPKRIVTIEFL